MTRVYAVRDHRYNDRANRANWFFPERSWIEVPEDVARVVLQGHPDKLMELPEDADPNEEVTRLNGELLPDDVDQIEESAPPPKSRTKKTGAVRRLRSP